MTSTLWYIRGDSLGADETIGTRPGCRRGYARGSRSLVTLLSSCP